MPFPPRTNVARKIDLTTEVVGVLPLGNSDPSLSTAVVDYYSLGTGADGQPLTLAKDLTNKLPFLRLQGGANITISRVGNALLFTGSSAVGGSGDMLTSVYDSDHDGIVSHASLADAVAYANITGLPTTFPPSAHTHAEVDITNLGTDLTARALTSTLINTANSLTGGGSLAANRSLSLVNDSATPGNFMYYATNGVGIRGWYADPFVAGGMATSVYATNGHTGWVDVAVLANSVAAGAVTSGGLAANAVTTLAIANLAVTAAKLATGAVASNLGFTPLNQAGDTMSGQLNVTEAGPTINTSTWQNGHLLLQTSGAGTGNPVLGFSRFATGDGTGGGVAIYYTGRHDDFNLVYSDGTVATLLSSLSPLSGANLTGTLDGGLLLAHSVLAGSLDPVGLLALVKADVSGAYLTRLYAPAATTQTLDCTGALAVSALLSTTVFINVALVLTNLTVGVPVSIRFDNAQSTGGSTFRVSASNPAGTQYTVVGVRSNPNAVFTLANTGIIVPTNTTQLLTFAGSVGSTLTFQVT